MDNILTIDQAQELGEQLKQEGKKTVLVGGCFDLLHFGHFSFLQEAKAQGDILIVLLESDARIQELKGATRPLHSLKQRADMLASLRFVDYVVLLSEHMTNQDYEKVTKALQPAIIATTKGSQGLHYIEKQAEEVDARIYIAKPVENLSTSHIVDLLEKEL